MSLPAREPKIPGPMCQPKDSSGLESLGAPRPASYSFSRGSNKPVGSLAPIPVTVEIVKVDAMPAGGVPSKWGITGKVGVPHSLDGAKVRIEHLPAVMPSIIALVEGHERGHVAYMDDMRTNDAGTTGADLEQSDTWLTEVDAWLRATDAMNRRLRPAEGKFLLDCLWSYGFHYADRREWRRTQDMFADRCVNSDMIREYVPLDPPKNEDGDTPEPDSEVEVGEPGEGNPLDNGEPGEPGEDEPGDEPGKKALPGDAIGLDRWTKLMGPEPIALAGAGDKRALQAWMRAHGLGHALDNLPPILEAILGY